MSMNDAAQTTYYHHLSFTLYSQKCCIIYPRRDIIINWNVLKIILVGLITIGLMWLLQLKWTTGTNRKVTVLSFFYKNVFYMVVLKQKCVIKIVLTHAHICSWWSEPKFRKVILIWLWSKILHATSPDSLPIHDSWTFVGQGMTPQQISWAG